MHVVQPSALLEHYYSYGSALNGSQAQPHHGPVVHHPGPHEVGQWGTYASPALGPQPVPYAYPQDNGAQYARHEHGSNFYGHGNEPADGTIEPRLTAMPLGPQASPDVRSEVASKSGETDSGRECRTENKRVTKKAQSKRKAAVVSNDPGSSGNASPAQPPVSAPVSSSSLRASQQRPSVMSASSDDYSQLPETDRRSLKRQKNREAAARCRYRRKKLIEDLEKQIFVLTGERDELKKQMQQLLARCAQLESSLAAGGASSSDPSLLSG